MRAWLLNMNILWAYFKNLYHIISFTSTLVSRHLVPEYFKWLASAMWAGWKYTYSSKRTYLKKIKVYTASVGSSPEEGSDNTNCSTVLREYERVVKDQQRWPWPQTDSTGFVWCECNYSQGLMLFSESNFIRLWLEVRLLGYFLTRCHASKHVI